MKLRRLGSWLHLVVAGALMGLVWVLLVWVGSRPALRTLIDLSPGQRASVDPVTKDLLQELRSQDVKIEFHCFFMPSGAPPRTEEQQQMKRILGRLRELTTILLKQYAFLGGDAVQVREHDQYADIAGTNLASKRFGVDETDVVVVAVQQPGKPPRHRKLSLEGDLAVIDWPQLQPNQPQMPRSPVPILKDYKGEEALSSALKSLLVQGTPIVYFLNNPYEQSLFHPAVGSAYGGLQQALLNAGFDVRTDLELGRSGTVPKDASLVAVLEPRRDFADAEVQALRDYLRRGGRLFLNYSWHPEPDWNPSGGDLGKLLGFEVGPQEVFHRIPDRMGGPGIDGSENVNKLDLVLHSNHPITQRMYVARQWLQVGAARPLVPSDPPSGVRREPLLSTGPYGWLARAGEGGRPDYRAPRALALDSFTVGMVAEVDGEQPDEHGKKPTGAAVVVSGVFCNNLGMPLNGNLALNIFNWLAERRVLLDIHGSRYVARHLRLDEPQLDRIKWFLEAGVPGAFLLLGLLVFWRRRDR